MIVNFVAIVLMSVMLLVALLVFVIVLLKTIISFKEFLIKNKELSDKSIQEIEIVGCCPDCEISCNLIDPIVTDNCECDCHV